MSLKGDKYETVEEIQTRLMNSVVLYDSKPVYVASVSKARPGDGNKDIARVHIAPVALDKRLDYTENDNTERKFISSRLFDLKPFKMGFMNYGGETYYLSRTPQRQYTQGLTGKTLKIEAVSNPAAGGRLDMHTLLYSKEFRDCIMGEYPLYDNIRHDDKRRSIALSRDFAFTRDEDLDLSILNYKTSRCGINTGQGFKLSKKFQYLKEVLEEARIPVA